MAATVVMTAQVPVLRAQVTRLPASGKRIAVRAKPGELVLLAAACGVSRFESVEAELTLAPWRRGGVELSGEIRAVSIQPCVVTLEPVEQVIRAPILVHFLPEGSSSTRRQSAAELVLDPDDDDVPETFSGDSLDLWPVIVEWLNLAIDPFPRKQGAMIDQRFAGQSAKEEPDNPFAVLGDLARRQSRKP